MTPHPPQHPTVPVAAALRTAATALLLTLAALPALGQPMATLAATIHDAGQVDRGAEIEHLFSISNSGDAELEITEVKASCGCTVTEYPSSLAPGETGSILVKVDTSDFRGPIAKSATVYTNDPKNARINLVVKAAIRPLIEVQPGYARFLVIEGAQYPPSEQRLWSQTMPELEVRGVKSPYPYVSIDYAKKGDGEAESGDGNEWRITIELDDSAPQGPLMDFVIVETNHPDQPRVRIPLSGFVRPPIAVTPKVLDLGDREIDGDLPAKVELKVLGDDPVELGEVTVVDLDGVEAEVEEVEAGRVYNVVVTLGSGMKRGRVDGTITVETSSRRQPRVEIPVVGTVL